MISQQEITKLAKRCDMSQRAMQSFLGSNYVRVLKQEGDQSSEVRLEIGLNILQKDIILQHHSLSDLIDDAVRSYSRIVPIVFSWVKSGAFNSINIPENISYSNLLHACRTASRLRAELLRSCSRYNF